MMRRNYKVWVYTPTHGIEVLRIDAAAKGLLKRCQSSLVIGRVRYYGTYHGQFVLRDHRDEGKPVAHYRDKDALIAALTMLGETR